MTAFKPHPDFEVLQRLFPAVRELQQLADKHGIDDIFQDNGGKILQLCLCLGIDVLPGREGNDAVDVTTGGEFELKTLNVRKKGGFTTHHHMNPTIIEKYRRVTWIFAAYEGIELRAIWRLTPTQMEPWFENGHTNGMRRVGRISTTRKLPEAMCCRMGSCFTQSVVRSSFQNPRNLAACRYYGPLVSCCMRSRKSLAGLCLQ